MSTTDIDIIHLDPQGIKESIIKYLKSKSEFKDWNFEGSGLSTLIDILVNNTSINAFNLNMIGNELFLDTALHRNSVISRAKELNYVPRSRVAPTAVINVTLKVNENAGAITMNAGTPFISEAVNGISYNFVTYNDITAFPNENNEVVFENVIIKQGVVNTYSWIYDSESNPNQLFTIENKDIDLTTLRVFVRESATDSKYTEYTLVDDILSLTRDSEVFFVQEDFNQKYQFYFGDGYLGKSLKNGNIVEISYISTSGIASTGAESFTLGSLINGYALATVECVHPASNGSERETIESIKFTAPKMYKNQKRAVTNEDYVVVLTNNNYGFSFDTISVWGDGNITYVCAKPLNSLYLTESQKETIINQILIPSSVMTKRFTMVDPEYTFLIFKNTFVFNKSNFTSTEDTVRAYSIESIINYCKETLNTFNSTFNSTEMWKAIKDSDKEIVSYDFDLWLQKRWMPSFDEISSIQLKFDNAIQKNSIEVYPSFKQYDSDGILHDICYIVEIDNKLCSGYYLNDKFVTIQENLGYVDYENGIIHINGLVISSISNDMQMLYFNVKSKTRNISVKENRILTFDTSDKSSVQTLINYL